MLDALAKLALPVGPDTPTVGDGFLAFALALVIALLATPVAGALAWRIGAIDEPREG